MDELPDEPAIKDRVALETQSGPWTLVHKATIANLTPEEMWVAVGKAAGESLAPESQVRVILTQSSDRSLTAETSVRRMVGSSGRMAALWRPRVWVARSRRVNDRVKLAIPAYLLPDTNGTVVPARTTNIGVGGFQCVTDLPMAVGLELAASLMLSPTMPLECRAQVVRLSDDPDDPLRRQLVVAFRFVNLSPDDEARVAEALIALSDETDPTAVPSAWRSEARGVGGPK